MPSTLYASGKRCTRSLVVATAADRKCPLLYISDRNSGHGFLVDSGAEISVVPPSGKDTRSGKRGESLTAANGSNIKAYGTRTIHLLVNTRRFKWTFTIADVSQPLLEADFLRAHALLVDIKGRRLIDSKTFESMELHCALLLAPQLGSVTASDNEFARILAAYPDVVKPHFHSAMPKHGRSPRSRTFTSQSRCHSQLSETNYCERTARVCWHGNFLTPFRASSRQYHGISFQTPSWQVKGALMERCCLGRLREHQGGAS